jgi:hypothetical protein
MGKPDAESKEIELAERLWNELRESLSLCGEIGEFCPDDFILEDIPRLTLHGKPVLPLPVLRRLLELDVQINEVFWNVYEALAIAAAKKLGFHNELAVAFADALSCLRTGMAGGHHTQAEQCISQDIFLKAIPYRADWNPGSIALQKQLKLVFEKFKEWERDPEGYRREIQQFWAERQVGKE